MCPAELKTFRPPRYAGGRGAQKKRKRANKPKKRYPLLGSKKPRSGVPRGKPRLKPSALARLKKEEQNLKSEVRTLKVLRTRPSRAEESQVAAFGGNPKKLWSSEKRKA